MRKARFRIASGVLAAIMTAVFCVQAVLPCMVFAAPAVAADDAYISTGNAPVLYGTTAIRVPTGEKVDYKHDARFRIFAKDNEEFDLTQKIESYDDFDENGENVAGEYHIYYSVEDKDGNSVKLTVPVKFVDNSKEIWFEKTMYTLPSVDHLNELGYTRGNYMDRQTIGLYLDVDDRGAASFQMRKTSGADNLTVTLNNNDSYCESSATVSGVQDKTMPDEGWVEIKNTGVQNQPHERTLACVPFVKTLYKQSGPVVFEIKYNAEDTRITPVHYYHEGDGKTYEETFLQEWLDDTDSFAVLDGVSLVALMPYEDRKLVGNKEQQRSFDSFDEMFTFWTNVCDAYDKLIGISYTPENKWDQAVKTKFFVRANKHGAGGAYYAAGDCIGKNSTSMYSALHPWWGTLHEYGHGYQGHLGNDTSGMPSGMHITEVGVNIFSYYVQSLSGLYPYTDYWLTGKNGTIDTLDDAWNQKRKEGVPYSDSEPFGSGTALYVLVNMLLTFDEYQETYAFVNQYYRKVYYTQNKKLNTADAWVLAFQEKYNVNLVPYFESWGLTVTDEVKNEMMLSNATVIYYVNDMAGDAETAAEIRDKYETSGDYGLITMDKIAQEKLSGKVKLQFNISDFSAIENKYLTINNGGETVERVKVTSKEMTLTLPVGVYKVAPPRGNTPLSFDRFYMTVVNGQQTEYEITYTDPAGASNGNELRIECHGYWWKGDPTDKYCPFIIITDRGNLTITYRGTNTSGNGTTMYSQIRVCNADGEEIYEKHVDGGALWTDKASIIDNIQASLGARLTVYYRGNKANVTVTDLLTGKQLPDYGIQIGNTVTYVLTGYGWVPETLAEDGNALYNAYKDRVNDYIASFLSGKSEEDLNNPFADPEPFNRIVDLISQFTPQDRAQYAGVFTSGESPEITFRLDGYTYYVGEFDLNTFLESELTITDVEDGTIDVDNSEKVNITSSVKPNKAGVYGITVTVTDKHGNVSEARVTVEIMPAPDISEGDFNGDGAVDATDFVMLRRYLLDVASGLAGNGDLNHDGVTDIRDLVHLKKQIVFFDRMTEK